MPSHKTVSAFEYPAQDVASIVADVGKNWEALRGKSLFITGGTGFFGTWLLSSFLKANEALELGAKVAVLTRNPRNFKERHPFLCDKSSVILFEGDVRSFESPVGSFDFVIHGAAETKASLYREEPQRMLETIVDGTRRVLQFARGCGAQRVLHISSGAVYGAQPGGLPSLSEDYVGAPNPSDDASAYGTAKRVAEQMTALLAIDGLIGISARCFAFVGPGLPLDGHYAVGNFIRDALARRPIVVRGDGRPLRSYLYASDLTLWLWTLLFMGKPRGIYNVGSNEEVSIAELASIVSRIAGDRSPVEILGHRGSSQRENRYLPDVSRVRSELGLRVRVPLADAIRKTLDWEKQCLARGSSTAISSKQNQ